MTTRERFEAKTEPEPNSGCVIWTGAYSKDGYGFFTLNGRQERAHRAAWLLAGRPLDPEVRVLHHCDVRCCVRLDHLFAGTDQDNMDDRYQKGKYAFGSDHHNGRKTHCPKGHAYEGDNVRVNSSGSRICIACRDATNRSRR